MMMEKIIPIKGAKTIKDTIFSVAPKLIAWIGLTP